MGWSIGFAVLVVIVIALYVYRPWAKKRYDRDADIPFQDDRDKIPHDDD